VGTIRDQIITCQRCPRLREYCRRVAMEKKAAYRHEEYWGRPVPGFGDPHARLLILGLAPAAHGGNRTGRVFTGDGSGDFLAAALHRTGFANLPVSRHCDDGLALTGAWIAAAVRCAPPDNTPRPAEIAACHPHLEAEVAALPPLRLVVALGRIAFDSYWRLMSSCGVQVRPKPPFGHGFSYAPAPGVPAVIASYHPSRQNTNTGRLTPPMLDAIFLAARERLQQGIADR
jgi:uracil-DNA glycosylase